MSVSQGETATADPSRRQLWRDVVRGQDLLSVLLLLVLDIDVADHVISQVGAHVQLVNLPKLLQLLVDLVQTTTSLSTDKCALRGCIKGQAEVYQCTGSGSAHLLEEVIEMVLDWLVLRRLDHGGGSLLDVRGLGVLVPATEHGVQRCRGSGVQNTGEQRRCGSAILRRQRHCSS